MTVTIKEIANIAGVSHSTVSRALRGHSRIGEETRRRIQEIAERLGYRPDPALSALVAYRTGISVTNRYGKIAVLCHRSEQDGMPPHLEEYLQGIRSRASRLGCEVEVFQIGEDERNQRRLNRVLFHRGIEGIIILPLPSPPKAFEWAPFTVVGIGENSVPLCINNVSYDHDVCIEETYRQLKMRGYRRIGFRNLLSSEQRNRMLFLSAYLRCLYLDGAPSLPPLLYEDSDPAISLSWIRKHRLDAVISHISFIDELKAAGFDNPEVLGIAGFAASLRRAQSGRTASYVIDGERLGALAVDLLRSMLHRCVRGLPEPGERQSILLRGHWQDGLSIRPV